MVTTYDFVKITGKFAGNVSLSIVICSTLHNYDTTAPDVTTASLTDTQATLTDTKITECINLFSDAGYKHLENYNFSCNIHKD